MHQELYDAINAKRAAIELELEKLRAERDNINARIASLKLEASELPRPPMQRGSRKKPAAQEATQEETDRQIDMSELGSAHDMFDEQP